jgi:nicotinamidase-related amidase
MLDRQQAALLVIDAQTRLLPHIDRHEEVVAGAAALIETAGLFRLPILATVQYTSGLGHTHDQLASLLAERGVTPREKAAFSVCRDEPCLSALRGLGRRQVIITGIEAHVCVQQTVLHLLEASLLPVVCADAVSSRRARDRELALERMRAAGAVVTTTEAVMFELCEVSGTPEFKALLAIVKRFDRAREAAVQDHAGVV